MAGFVKFDRVKDYRLNSKWHRLRERQRTKRTGLRRWLGNVLLVLVVVPALIFVVYRVVPPPVTPLMIIRLFEGYGLTKDWVPLSRISPNLQRAVIASEDAKFCQHRGFDWEAVDNAIERNARGQRTVGASTISMQTSKNLLLWPGRNFLRKGAEAYLTVWLEGLLPKRRIMELYLNEIEWGQGIYGAEAAARTYFGVSAAQLTPQQAALMAAVLPNPLNWRPDRPGPYISDRASTIRARMASVPLAAGGPCP
ncbi:MAG: monofunctional biosynthetic peptidoglycan transglycosylase [Parvibaculum sp.]|nr:monofunctional biosynthetic peptidoglycan transglycosylase [Parvibaculum sp.]